VASPLTIRFFFLGQIAALSNRYDMTIITNADDPHFLDRLGISAKVIALPIARDVSLWHDAWVLFRLIFIFRQERFDLVHTLSPKTGLLGMVAAWVSRVPIRVHVFQGEVWATRVGLWRLFLKSMDRLMATCATDLLVVSASENQYLVEQGVVRKGQLRMLANGSVCGVDLKRFYPDANMRDRIRRQLGIPEDALIILFVGRLNQDKGVLDLAEAFSCLAPSRPSLHLLLVGPDEGGIQDRISTRHPGLRANIHFVRYTARPEDYMAASDMLCLPSYREGFGMVLIEAAAVGLPTVGSRIYGITDAVLDGETGLLFEVKNIVDLTEKLRVLLDAPGLRIALAEAGQQRVRQEFSSDMVQSALFDFYQNLLRTGC